MGPAGLFAKMIVAGVLAATEEEEETASGFFLTCSQIGASPRFERVKRVHLTHFSVESPLYGSWCVKRQEKDRVAYATSPYLGVALDKQPSLDSLMNTLVIAASRVKTRSGAVAQAGGVLPFARKWIRDGAEITLENGDAIVDFRSPSRFKMLTHELSERSVSGTTCLDYGYTVEERDNPSAPGKIFLLQAVGILCPDPVASDVLIVLNFSERYVIGEQADSGLFKRILDETAQPFFDSLEFSPAAAS